MYYNNITANYEGFDESRNASGTTYRSSISPRVTTTALPRPLSGLADGVTTRIFRNIQTTSHSVGQSLSSLIQSSGIPMRGLGNSSPAVVVYNDLRLRDKNNLVTLNDKFAQYVESVRFLEAQNRKLSYELEALKNRTGLGSSAIKKIYEIEIDSARKTITETNDQRDAANVKAKQAEDEVRKQKERYVEVMNISTTDRKAIDDLERRISENEAQINLFRRRIKDLEEEGDRYKNEQKRLQADIKRLQNDIQNEVLLKTTCDTEKFRLDDEIASLKIQHAAALDELRSRLVTVNLDPHQFLDDDLVKQLREIRADYERTNETQRATFQSRFSMEINEIIRHIPPEANSMVNEQHRRQVEMIRTDLNHVRNQNSHLKAENEIMKSRIDELVSKIRNAENNNRFLASKTSQDIIEARERYERINHEYDELTNLKTSLEKEINTYRELLESQNGLGPFVNRMIANAERPPTLSLIANNETMTTTVVKKIITTSSSIN